MIWKTKLFDLKEKGKSSEHKSIMTTSLRSSGNVRPSQGSTDSRQSLLVFCWTILTVKVQKIIHNLLWRLMLVVYMYTPQYLQSKSFYFLHNLFTDV